MEGDVCLWSVWAASPSSNLEVSLLLWTSKWEQLWDSATSPKLKDFPCSVGCCHIWLPKLLIVLWFVSQNEAPLLPKVVFVEASSSLRGNCHIPLPTPFSSALYSNALTAAAASESSWWWDWNSSVEFVLTHPEYQLSTELYIEIGLHLWKIKKKKAYTSESHKATKIDYVNYCHYQNCCLDKNF